MRSEPELLRWLDARLTRSHDRAVFDLNVEDEPAKVRPSAL
jgi:hypothetical protein